MKYLKDKTLSIHTSAEIKQLLQMAVEKEHRSIAIYDGRNDSEQRTGLIAKLLPTEKAKNKKGSDGTD